MTYNDARLADEAKAGAIAYHLANDEFVAAAMRQNKAVEQLKADSARRIKQAQEAAETAQEKARLFYIAADKIRKTKMKGDACHSADALFNAYLESNK